MTDEALKFLQKMADNNGTWPDVIARRPVGVELMQKGLIELVKPDSPYLPFARLTTAGRKRIH